jgi:hypothetical protein
VDHATRGHGFTCRFLIMKMLILNYSVIGEETDMKRKVVEIDEATG